jgi:O-antigen biosynthesis protein
MTVAFAHPERFPGAGDGPRRFAPDVGSQGDRECDRIVALAGRGRDVLVIGDGGPLASALRSRDCRVVAIEADRAREPGGDRFDVLVAADLLPRVEDPGSILRLAGPALRPGGSLIATVPNVAHGSVRLSLLGGRFPYEQGVLAWSHRRFFTRDSLLALLEDAGFLVGHVESIDLPALDPDAAAEPDVPQGPPGPPEELAGDPDARAARFIVVAHPLPHPGLDWIQGRFRELAEQKEAATREAGELRRIVASMTAQVESLSRLAGRERETHARLMDAHAQLAERDRDFREQHARRMEEVREILARHDREARARIVEVIAERDTFVARCGALEARLEQIRGTLPAKLYRKARSLLSLGRR